MSNIPKAGEIYYLLEGGHRHRCIVISREALNRGNNAIVIPVTSQKYDLWRKLPNCVAFGRGRFGFTEDCVAQAEGITVLEKAELDLEGGCLGRLDSEKMRDLIRAVGDMMGADCEPGH